MNNLSLNSLRSQRSRALCRISMTGAAAVVVSMLMAAPASAGTQTIGPVNFGPSSIPGGPSVVGTLAKFDTTLGTLTKVELLLTATTSGGSAQASANINGQDLELGEPGNNIDITLGMGSNVIASGEFGGLAVTTAPFNQFTFLNVPPLQMVNYSHPGATDTDTGPGLMGAAVNPYKATFLGEDFDVTIERIASTSFIVLGNGTAGGLSYTHGNVSGQISVIYTFVPEPTSFALAGFGAVVLGAARRFRRR